MNVDEILKDSESLLARWIEDPTLVKFVLLIGGLLFLRFVSGLVLRTASDRIDNPENVHFLRKLLNVVFYLLAFLLLTGIFRDKLGGLTVAFGVAGAGIAFALQEVIVSIAGWVAISLGNFYRVGDRVELGGTKGDVIGIGMLRTTLMEIGDWVDGDLYNGRIVRLANSFVFKEPVYNYSSDFPFLWDELKVPVKYGSDWELTDRLLRECCNEIVGDYTQKAKSTWKKMVKTYQIENAVVEPMVTMIANDNWIEFTVRYVTDFKLRRSTKDKLFRAILRAVDDNAEKVGLASATFHLVETPAAMNVRMIQGGAGGFSSKG
jgi:small-conductance mechanosensitive channel